VEEMHQNERKLNKKVKKIPFVGILFNSREPAGRQGSAAEWEKE